MTRILVTGGAGGLGSALVPLLRAAGHGVRIGSSRPKPEGLDSGLEWAQGDLLSGEGLVESVAGIETIVHCASNPFKKTWETDVEGTKRLLDAAKAAGAGHFYFISIVGVDRMTLPYYKAKYAAEQAIEASGIPFTILRATQFHTLLDAFMRQRFKLGPFLFVPGAAKFQLIDTSEVAARMAETVENGPSGRLTDIGGPEVLTGAEIAKPWPKVSGVRVIRVPVPALGPIGQLAKGLGCCPENMFGVITGAQWLEKTYGRRS